MIYIRILSFFLVFFLVSLTPVAQAAPEKRIALVIGNSAYSFGPLKNPVNDAADMAALLKKLGFSVTLKKNANIQEMIEAIEDFGNTLKKGGVGLFYYAGHGVQVSGVNYLLPISARINKESDIRFQAVDTGRVLAEMENANNGLNIVILDACRDNPFGKSFRSASRGLAIVNNAPTGTFISYSTGAGQVARDGEGRNSPYTSALLHFMQEPGIPITDVFIKARQKLRKETGQIPWELSSLEGSFYFASKGAVTAASGTAQDDLEAERRALAEEKARLQKEKDLLEQKQALAEERKRLEEQRKLLEQAHVAPRPSPGTFGRILFYDDFSSRKNGWPVYENGQFYNTAFRENRYVMETKNERNSTELIALPSGATENYDIELTSIWQKGVTGSAYGLGFGQDRENAYLFGISGNGQSVIWVTVNNVPVDDAMPWKVNAVTVSDGRLVENTQRVEVRGEYLSYYVNNVFMARIRNQFPLKSFGVCVSRQQTVAFTRFKITQR